MGWQGLSGIVPLGGQAVCLALPPTPFAPGPTRLVATLALADTALPIATWDFLLAATSGGQTPGGQILVSPASFDQAFLILDHPESPPLGRVYHLAVPPPATKGFDLVLRRSGGGGESFAHYRLHWPDEASRIRDLERWRRQAVPPVDWFYVELTSHCNLACPFCPSRTLKRPRAFLSEDHARLIFSKIADYGRRRDATWGYTQTERMVFLHVMGEPLLHPRFTEIVSAARAVGLVPGLFTNATLLNAKARDKIFASGLSHITISLNVTDQAGYAELGARGLIDEQERRVLDLLAERKRRGAHRLHVDIQYIVAAPRAEGGSSGGPVAGRGLVDSRHKAWASYRTWLLRLRHLDPQGPVGAPPAIDPRPSIAFETLLHPLADDTGDPSLRLPLDGGVDLVMKTGCSFGNAVIPPGHRVVPASQGRCPFSSPWRQMAVFVDGRVSFCNMDYENSVDLGSLLDSSVDEIWDGARLRRIREEMAADRLSEPLCQRCLGTLAPMAGPA
ncbi:radical SAM family protein [Rhodospirillum rubrum F11]|uniref:Radical SAM n=1 Tax=Rhodospirillum rubrum (strain ATCC 11170 / ATH 1.1.1 / DSM 467 / LMG 4362 / NCIMB 8255 / S1) TaxID=269796 RepID=Q2RWD0_RHORT|nr:radical SAM/SPASM domain-containing protein [Rhodospirillum rubrum]ABC21565.1 Radical SAM [Rhodospirillum rubrum ATCC 11170]AEO47250.1 radical SAM family protein [Rhodospirillum rubrum F11]MBK5953184.1 radical SAM protein [Rhodospirillum rubrum]QXG81234.1 SPASM domain-containing protein [Rhodospirillum rubrum]HAP98549.1 radical SAM protein [Rhodospirillum rubrum]